MTKKENYCEDIAENPNMTIKTLGKKQKDTNDKNDRQAEWKKILNPRTFVLPMKTQNKRL